jgi:hypothetical protein
MLVPFSFANLGTAISHGPYESVRLGHKKTRHAECSEASRDHKDREFSPPEILRFAQNDERAALRMKSALMNSRKSCEADPAS